MANQQYENAASDNIDQTNGRLVGYARVSTAEQDLALQRNALLQAGCESELIFTDKISGVKADRPGLAACLEELHVGDTLVVWRLDRLGRSVRHLVSLVEDLQQRQVGFRSLSDGAIDTTTASGKLIFGVFAALAEFERSLIQERTNAGLAAARARGRIGGRPRLDQCDPRISTAKTLHRDPTLSIGDITEALGISKATLYRWLKVS